MSDVIYVAPWRTESGDDGVLGYFTERPTEEQLTQLFSEIMPEEFEEGVRYVFWDVEELELRALPVGIPTVEPL